MVTNLMVRPRKINLGATAHMRGHNIVYDWDTEKWYYEDDLSPADDSRACVRCNRKPTAEGHDACIGNVKGVISACCGHGVGKGFMVG